MFPRTNNAYTFKNFYITECLIPYSAFSWKWPYLVSN